MTRMLSQLLGAREPAFRIGLNQLERAGGGTSEDVRLTADMLSNQRDCLRELGLDPQDTTSRELYAALMQRVRDDSEAFEQLLGGVAGAQAMPAVASFVGTLPVPKQVFALKTAAAKRLLRKHPPKRALKQLGYRSIESVMKHEPAALLFAAARMAETAAWHKAMQAEYRRLSASDFEQRTVQVIYPADARWNKLTQSYVAYYRTHIMSLRELGVIVLLPFDAAALSGALLATALLTLQAVNDMRSASTYLKLHIVRPDFGSVVAAIAGSEPVTKAELAGGPLPWKLVHHYFSRHPDAYNPDIFEPHVQPEDLQWHSAEEALAAFHPRFDFWHKSAHVGLLHQGEVVSMNLADTILSFCNRIPFEQRLVSALRGQLWHELLLRYMRQSNIEREVHRQLGSELLDELVDTGALA